MIAIHDPIHGPINVSSRELKLIDARAFQRLRFIRQLGFTELAFPGATHSRFAHSVGAMHVAHVMAEHVLQPLHMPALELARVHQTLRLAVLFHDLGHPPLSHAGERVMPPLAQLGLDPAWWTAPPASDTGASDAALRQATHEDYTVKILVDSELTRLIAQHFGDEGITGPRIAALLLGRPPPGDAGAFQVEGVDLLGLLHQIVSGELDADRMDYLRRDAYFCGVPYGQFDHPWLINQLTAVEHNGRWALALKHKGVWAFENFLLARYHMFLAVYYHHTPVCFDYLLGQYFKESDYMLPADAAAFLDTDDMHLWAALRRSPNSWARQVALREPYRMLLERHGYGVERRDDAHLEEALQAAGIDFFKVQSQGVLSKYFGTGSQDAPLWVVESAVGRLHRIEDYTPLFRRYQEVASVARIYCRPDDLERARGVLRASGA